MTEEFRFLVQLTAAGCRGESIQTPGFDIDWRNVERLANEQMITALVGYALKLSPELGCSKDIKDRAIITMRRTAIVNSTKKSAIINLIGRMERAGIHVILLKGFEVASCYAAPETRAAGDTDILIDPKDERCAYNFLEQEGFHVQPRWKHGHHAVASHPELGILELHVLLYDEIIEDMWFGKNDGMVYIQEPHRLVRTTDGDYYTLGYTDKLIFIALHTIKHFIESGMSLRMMLDIALWITRWKEALDMDRFWSVMTSLRYERLMNCILQSLVIYGSFVPSDFPGMSQNGEKQISIIMADLENGGWMGMQNKSAREEGWHEYNRQKMLQRMKPWQYVLYMVKWRAGNIRRALFPTKFAMVEKYPFLAKAPICYPFAWAHRLVFRGSKALLRDSFTKHIVSDEKQLSEIGKERVKMFKELEML